ncbi:MAG: disulfide bond formation protein B [Gammaproteobacteria bacterium]
MSFARRVFLGIFLVCAMLLGGAYYLEYYQGADPCPLCYLQRVFFALAGVMALVACLHDPGRTATIIYASLLDLFGLAGALVAGRQVWLQHLPPEQVPECGPGLEYMLEIYPFGDAIAKALQGTGECAEAGWTLFGQSLAMWALGFFILIMAASMALVILSTRSRGSVG